MPVDPDAAVRISAFRWVPDFAKGQVRDLRARWALEEAGIPYAVRKLDATSDRPADYFAEQPFGQVPSYRDDQVQLFESGAIVLHIAARSEALLPSDEEGRARATAWLIAALNSVEPAIIAKLLADLFWKDEPWAKDMSAKAAELVEARLNRLSDWLGEKEWLEDRFTAGDLLMVSVLRILERSRLLAKRPNLVAYVERGIARPAFKAALAAQLADFEESAAVAA